MIIVEAAGAHQPSLDLALDLLEDDGVWDPRGARRPDHRGLLAPVQGLQQVEQAEQGEPSGRGERIFVRDDRVGRLRRRGPYDA